MKKLKEHKIKKQAILALFILFGLHNLSYSQESTDPTSTDTNVENVEYDFVTLSERYGNKTAIDLKNGIVKFGDSKAMVYHALGTPYLIEEPYGPMLDYEIQYFNTAVVFIEYGVVINIKKLEKPNNSNLAISSSN